MDLYCLTLQEMRLLLLFAVSLVAFAEAGDDATYCVNECVKKYETENANSTIAKVGLSTV